MGWMQLLGTLGNTYMSGRMQQSLQKRQAGAAAQLQAQQIAAAQQAQAQAASQQTTLLLIAAGVLAFVLIGD